MHLLTVSILRKPRWYDGQRWRPTRRNHSRTTIHRFVLPKNLPRRLRVVAFNLALTLLLAELAGLVGYYLRTGKLYYLAPPSGRSVTADVTGGVGKYRLHPFFGFVQRPGRPGSGANNHGFESRHDYPYERRRAGEYVVGIFGGSVAVHLAQFESEHHVLARRLAAALAREPGDVTVLSFAQGGFKQPQQLLVHDYFRALGQELDLVINVDGFNEVALAGRNVRYGVAVDMPSFDHLGPLRDAIGQASDLDSIDRMLRLRSDWQKFARTFNRAWSGEGWELTFTSGFLADFLIYKFYWRRYQAGLREHVEKLGHAGGDTWLLLGQPRPDDDSMERAVALWARASEMLHQTQQAAGGRYLHVIQPNQYFATGRRFSDAERAVALAPESPYAEYVRAGYPRLVARVEPLRQRGVAVISLAELFDGVAEPVYQDDCCHYNETGQRLVVEAIAEAVAGLSTR